MELNQLNKQYYVSDASGNYPIIKDSVVSGPTKIESPYVGLVYYDTTQERICAIKGIAADGETITSTFMAASTGHTHDTAYLKLTGGTLSGTLSAPTIKTNTLDVEDSSWLYVNHDTEIGGDLGIDSNAQIDGNLNVDNNVTAAAFYESSDERYKDEIKPIESETIVPEVKSFIWKETGKKSYGFIAQDVEKDYPELVQTKDDGFKTVNYSATLALVVGKLQQEIQDLKNRVKELESK